MASKLKENEKTLKDILIDAPDGVISPNSFLVLAKSGDTVYQIFRGPEQLRLIRLGNHWSLDPSLIIHADDYFRPRRGNTSISIRDIEYVLCSYSRSGKPYLDIRERSFNMNFLLLSHLPRNTICEILAGIDIEFRSSYKGEVVPRQQLPTAEELKIHAIYKTITVCLGLVSCVFAGGWLVFFEPYYLFEILNLMVPILSYIAFCAFYNVTRSMHRDQRTMYTLWSWFPSMSILLVRSMVDFQLDSIYQIIAPAFAITILASTVFIAFNARNEKLYNRILTALVCISIWFAPLASIHLNFLLDDGSQVKKQQAIVVDKMYYPAGNKGMDTYYVYLSVDGASEKIKTDKTTYTNLEAGDIADVIITTGPLGIAYKNVSKSNVEADVT